MNNYVDNLWIGVDTHTGPKTVRPRGLSSPRGLVYRARCRNDAVPIVHGRRVLGNTERGGADGGTRHRNLSALSSHQPRLVSRPLGPPLARHAVPRHDQPQPATRSPMPVRSPQGTVCHGVAPTGLAPKTLNGVDHLAVRSRARHVARSCPEPTSKAACQRGAPSAPKLRNINDAPRGGNVGHAELAEALLDPSSRCQYLVSRLVDIDERWEALAPRQGNGALLLLGRDFGAAVVIQALSYMAEERHTVDEGHEGEHVFPFLRRVCEGIAR